MNYEQIEAIRNLTGASKAEFAAALGVPLSTYYCWSQPKRQPNSATLPLLRVIEKAPVAAFRATKAAPPVPDGAILLFQRLALIRAEIQREIMNSPELFEVLEYIDEITEGGL